MSHVRPKNRKRRETLSLRMALSYSLFLLVCLALSLGLFLNATHNARDTFWTQRTDQLARDADTLAHYLSVMNNYTRQFLNDSTFVRLSNMAGPSDQGFIRTAYDVMQGFSARMYSLLDMPVTQSNVYLSKSGYVISASQFTEVREYYDHYRILTPGLYDQWLEALVTSGAEGTFLDAQPFTGVHGAYFFARDIDAILNRSVPAVILFEMDMKRLRSLFLSDDMGEDAVVVVCGEDGTQKLVLSDGDAAQVAQAMQAAAYDSRGFAAEGNRVYLRVTADNGWVYMAALDRGLCDEALGRHDAAFVLVLIVALAGGAALVFTLVRHNMRPIRQMGTQLQKAEDDRDRLMKEMDDQRPMLCASYLRKLLSGHVSSEGEFSYMMNFLSLEGAKCFYVLYAKTYRRQDATADPAAEHEAICDHIHRFLAGDFPVYFYTTLDRSYVVLAAYGDRPQDPLMDLQRRVLSLHNDLDDRCGLWFYCGVGERCADAKQLWESYEQARAASRFTAKTHIFLPYEMMRKDSASFYYPVEISAKLQHFITTGNKSQVQEMFALIHRENFVERSLPVKLLSFLLSDLKNTLLKARFQVAPQTPEETQRLNALDERLYEQPDFPQLEATALCLCEFFVRSAEPSDPIPEVERYLLENFTDPSMCLSKLSARFNISESYLSHLFKDRIGQNFSVYLENLRLNEAVRRLHDPQVNVSSLYEDLGYNNPTTFRRAFKKRHGISPSEMRASFKTSNPL